MAAVTIWSDFGAQEIKSVSVPNLRFLQPTESNRQQLNCLEQQPHLVPNTVSCPPVCFSIPITKTQTPKQMRETDKHVVVGAGVEGS